MYTKQREAAESDGYWGELRGWGVHHVPHQSTFQVNDSRGRQERMSVGEMLYNKQQLKQTALPVHLETISDPLITTVNE